MAEALPGVLVVLFVCGVALMIGGVIAGLNR